MSKLITQESNIIWSVTSQHFGKPEFTIHNYSKNIESARQSLETIALEALQIHLNKAKEEKMISPLRDTIPVDKISEGSTIRYTDLDQTIIELIQIEKVKHYYIIPEKIRTTIKVFKIQTIKELDEEFSMDFGITAMPQNCYEKLKEELEEESDSDEDYEEN